MKALAGQVAVVTGGGHGIGFHIARELAVAGAEVVVAGRQLSRLEEAVAQIAGEGGLARAEVVDVADRGQVDALMARVVAQEGRIDLLVNNAGRFYAIGPVWEADPDEWWRDVTTNLYGTFLCCRAVAPHMIERRAGKIINLAGGGSFGPLPYGTGYASSKVGVVRFSETFHEEIKEYGVKVYAIIPGLVRSEMTEYQLTSLAGKKWLKGIAQRFAEGDYVPPTLAGKLCAFLAGPGGDRLGGRFLFSFDDYAKIAERADEVAAKDLYTLRRTVLPD